MNYWNEYCPIPNEDFANGVKEGIKLFAWWKDGIQYVGTTGTTLKEALKKVDEAYPPKDKP